MAGPVENGNLEFSRVCLDRLQPIDLPRLSLVRLQLGDPGIIAISESVDIAKVRAAAPVRAIRVDPASTLWPEWRGQFGAAVKSRPRVHAAEACKSLHAGQRPFNCWNYRQ